MGKRHNNLCKTVLAALEPLMLVAVPATLAACAVLNVDAAAGLTLLVAVLAIFLMLASYESSRPALRQIMPTVTLAGLAAAGRVLFAPIPDVKPVSAVAIVAGASLGRRSGFMVGALAAFVSNFFFGQGAWTPWQMYAWGLVGYLSGVFVQMGLFGPIPSSAPSIGPSVYVRNPGKPLAKKSVAADAHPRGHKAALLTWGFFSAMLYGLILNGWYVIGYVHPITWPLVLAAYAAGFGLDCVHGVATMGFLALIWRPWGRVLSRVATKYGLGS